MKCNVAHGERVPGGGVCLTALEDKRCSSERRHAVSYGIFQRGDSIFSRVACTQADVVCLVQGKLFFVESVAKGSGCGLGLPGGKRYSR